MASNKKKSVPRKGDAEFEIVRRFKANPFVFIGTVVVLVIVIIAFVLVPAIVPSADGFSNTALTFGTWNKRPINYTPNGYFARVRSYYSQYADAYGMQEYQVWRQAFEDTVVFTAAAEAARKASYKPPAEVVDKRVAALSRFQENGRFSLTKYRSLPQSDRLALRAEVQDDIVLSRFTSDLSDIQLSAAEAAFIGAMAARERTFKMVAFPISGYPDSEVAAYAAEHASLFQSVHLSQITITSSESEGAGILAKLKDGSAVFEETARTSSQDSFADMGGEAGARFAYEFMSLIPDEAARNAVLEMRAGEMSELVKVPSGWAIFKAAESPRAANTQDEATLAKVRAYILSNERSRIDDYLLAQAVLFVNAAKETGFDEEAASRALATKEFGPLPVNYGGSPLFATLSSFGIAELSGAESSENFWRTAFAGQAGVPADPIVIGSNILVLYPVEEVDGTDGSGEEGSPAKNTENTYTSYWAEQTASSSVRAAILGSSKLEDNFYTVYFSLLQG